MLYYIILYFVILYPVFRRKILTRHYLHNYRISFLVREEDLDFFKIELKMASSHASNCYCFFLTLIACAYLLLFTYVIKGHFVRNCGPEDALIGRFVNADNVTVGYGSFVVVRPRPRHCHSFYRARISYQSSTYLRSGFVKITIMNYCVELFICKVIAKSRTHTRESTKISVQ